MSSRFVIFLHSSRYDRVFQAMNLLATAAGMERDCYLFLFYDALASFMDGSWADFGSIARSGEVATEVATKLERGFQLSGSPSPYEILDRARGEGSGVRVCACTASVKFLDLDPVQVKSRVDELIGLVTMLDISEGAGQVLYI